MTVAIIAGIGTVISALISGAVALAVSKNQHDKTVAVIEVRLETLQKTVDKHNNLIERTYELENKADVLEEKMKVANHRIDDLEAAR